jgi:hypothetical protein
MNHLTHSHTQTAGQISSHQSGRFRTPNRNHTRVAHALALRPSCGTAELLTYPSKSANGIVSWFVA